MTSTVCMYDRTPAYSAFGLFIFAEKHRCENGWSTTPRFISFPFRAFSSMILRRKRPERKGDVHEFPVWNVHEAHDRSTAVGRNAPSRTQTIILQVVCCRHSYIGSLEDMHTTVDLPGSGCSWLARAMYASRQANCSMHSLIWSTLAERA